MTHPTTFVNLCSRWDSSDFLIKSITSWGNTMRCMMIYRIFALKCHCILVSLPRETHRALSVIFFSLALVKITEISLVTPRTCVLVLLRRAPSTFRINALYEQAACYKSFTVFGESINELSRCIWLYILLFYCIWWMLE